MYKKSNCMVESSLLAKVMMKHLRDELDCLDRYIEELAETINGRGTFARHMRNDIASITETMHEHLSAVVEIVDKGDYVNLSEPVLRAAPESGYDLADDVQRLAELAKPRQ